MNLFDPIEDSRDYHSNLRNALRGSHEGARDVLLAWADGFIDRDGKFVQEFQYPLDRCVFAPPEVAHNSVDRKNGSSHSDVSHGALFLSHATKIVIR